jgi:hypothetical protein
MDDVYAAVAGDYPVKAGTVILDKQSRVVKKKEKAARRLPIYVEGFAPLVPAKQDFLTCEGGARKRFARELPAIKPKAKRELRDTSRWVPRNYLDPIPADFEPTTEWWLENSSYTTVQKEHFLWIAAIIAFGETASGICKSGLRYVKQVMSRMYGQEEETAYPEFNLYMNVCHWNNEYFKNKSFIKAEAYGTYKMARWINSRSDFFKVLSGPFFKAIENEVFHKIPFFIKHIPITDRAAYINDLVGRFRDRAWFASDYSSFESGFPPEMVKACEMQLYSYMCEHNTSMKQVLGRITEALTGKQHCRAKCCKVMTYARMSGDMCTSLGNGWTNLMVAWTWARKNNFDLEGVVEGDDGLFAVPSEDMIPPPEFYQDLGFNIKLNKVDKVNEGGFCKMFYADGEPSNLQNPLPVVLKVGWSLSKKMHGGAKVMMELLRAKGYSLSCETPQCPILNALARWILRATSGYAIAEAEGWWEMEKRSHYATGDMEARLEKKPTFNQRLFVERMWGIPVENQLEIERWMDEQTEVGPITCPVLLNHLYGSSRETGDELRDNLGALDWAHAWSTRLLRFRAGDPW